MDSLNNNVVKDSHVAKDCKLEDVLKMVIVGKGREMNQEVELEELLLSKDVSINKSLPNYLLSKASVILLYVFANKFTTDS